MRKATSRQAGMRQRLWATRPAIEFLRTLATGRQADSRLPALPVSALPVPAPSWLAQFLAAQFLAAQFLAAQFLAALLLAALITSSGQAQPPSGQAATATPVEELALDQSRIADNYARLEQLMIRMAEAEAAGQPQRAALLKQAVQQSATRLTRGQLNAIAELLKPPAQMKRAIDQQQQALQDLNDLLQLLLSENRSDRLRDQQTRIREYLKELERIRRLEQGLQGRTEGGSEFQELQDDQDRVAARTAKLAESIQQDQQDASSQAAAESEPSDPQQGKPEEEANGELPAQPSDPSGREPSPPNEAESKGQGQAAEGESPPGTDPDKPAPSESQQSPPSQGGPSPEGQSESGNQGQPPEGDPGAAEQPTPESQARQRIAAAQQRMREAQQQLEQAERDQAIAKQEQALQELEKAKAALEQILRQLREEEMERTLALLESRFRRMLRSQLKIYESTQQLDKLASQDRGREIDIQASKLSFEQSKLVAEADRALNLLREEGSSVAFPATVEQMRDEMILVSDRLSVTQVGVITQAAEEDIIAALEELIAALQKAQEELDQQQQQSAQQMQSPPNSGDRPLVDQLAELKMIRALQMRVNKRTRRFAQLLKDMDDPVGQLFGEDLLRQLQKLSETQLRIHGVTRDIVVGKNR